MSNAREVPRIGPLDARLWFAAMADKTLRDEHAEITRRELIVAARALFSRRGYAKTGVDEIAARARVTRGALYHHFRGKKELFRAVFEEVQGDLRDTVARGAAAQTDAWERMRTSLRIFLDACTKPGIQRILLEDGPAVLGWAEWREIDARYFMGGMIAALEELIDAGRMRPLDASVLGHVILAAVTEAAMMLADADDVDATRREAERTIDALFEGLLD